MRSYFQFSLLVLGALAVFSHAENEPQKVLKDVYANHFRVGNILAWNTISNNAIKNLILSDYNSVTMENDMKPENTMLQERRTDNILERSTDNNIIAHLNDNAKQILEFCEKNGIPVRGHVLVWHGQSPHWFFTDDLKTPATPTNTESVNWASKEKMETRLESYINNLFKLIYDDYPNLKLYAYDVVNEAANVCGPDNARYGCIRPGGYDMDGAGGVGQSNKGNSPWTKIYGDNSFIESAFIYAKAARDKYFPNMKLFYNDFNEWDEPKRDYIIKEILIPLRDKGLLDGMGMQGHVEANPNNTHWSNVVACTTAMNKYADLGIEVQITEMDVGLKNVVNDVVLTPFTEINQANRYKAIFQHAMKINSRNLAENKDGKFTAMIIWGPSDSHSWRKEDDAATLHAYSNNQLLPKPAYDSLVNLVPQPEWGNGNDPPCCPDGSTIIEPDENGYYFHHTFENGNAQGWTGHGGNAAVANTSQQAANGNYSLAVTGRTAKWHGAEYNLSARIFAPGKEYSFSAIVMYADGPETSSFKLTLQYDYNGDPNYEQIDLKSATKNQWVLLENKNFLIPTGATNMKLFVEMPDAETTSFFIDDAMGGIAGKGNATPILSNHLPLATSHLPKYYNLKGIPLGATKPSTPGVYIEKRGKQIQRVVVR